MKKAYNKDVWRTIWKGKKRFISIMLITMLGVAMLTGLRAACVDLRYTVDEFLDGQNLYDICVVSTLGLNDEDVAALAALDGIAAAEGAYSETVHINVGDKKQNILLQTLSGGGMNVPYVVEGTLPQKADEIAVTVKFAQETGYAIGDTITMEEDVDDTAEAGETTETKKDDAVGSGETIEDEDIGNITVEIETEEEEKPNFLYTEYTVTAIVTDPMDINNTGGAVTFRAASAGDDPFFILPEAVDSDIYTAVYLTLDGGREMFCYSDAYEHRVAEVARTIEDEIKEQRELARYKEITGEATEKLAEARGKVDEKLAEAEDTFSEAEEELADGEQELADGERELADKEQEAADGFAEARAQIAEGYAAIADGKAQLDAAESQVEEGFRQLEQAKTELAQKEQETYAQIEDGKKQIEDGITQADAAAEQMKQQGEAAAAALGAMWPESEWNAYIVAAEEGDCAAEQAAFLAAISAAVSAIDQGISQQAAMLDPAAPEYEAQLAALEAQRQQVLALPGQMQQLAEGMSQVVETKQMLLEQRETLLTQEETAKQQFTQAWSQIEDSEGQLYYGKSQVDNGRGELSYNEAQLADGAAELEKQEQEVKKQLADGRRELADGRQELLDGQKELADKKAEYEEKKAEAEEKLADAEKEIKDIDMTQWYVQDRTSLSGYANVKSDASSIEAIGTVFPILFFVVAILISLTTITRMVEEDRGLIGTYKALGFTDREVRRKYLLYALSASLMGGILGNVCGFVVLPGIIFVIFDSMYLLPAYQMQFDLLHAAAGALLFIGGIVGATAIACKAELLQAPAVLMRPKAPRSGSRVFLERIGPIWNRFSFLNKVTARNLFRYKKRLFMTIAGIMGCMALLLFGFAIKDSVSELMPRQYEQVYRYDLMAVALAEDNEQLLSYVSEDDDVSEYVNAYISSVKVKNTAGGEEKVQMIVAPDGASLAPYIQLTDLDGQEVTLADGEVFVTQNAADVVGFREGDSVYIQDTNLMQAETVVHKLVKNYLGNNVYMTQATYENLFGTYEPNGVLLNFLERCEDEAAYADALGKKDGVLSSVSTKALKQEFSSAFVLINMVVYIVIIMAACLAFVVLFTLSSTNISERNRELATIKVLGFFDREVHLYVHKETLILTSIGILLGIPLGYAFAQSLTYVLKMPSMYLAVSLYGTSYAAAAALSFGFALLVNFITNHTLDVIDPVEALKSIE